MGRLRAYELEGPLRDALHALVERGLTLSFAGTVYRVMRLEYSSPEDAVSGSGAARWGGRWNPPGLATFYASTTYDVAHKEVRAAAKYYGASVTSELPRVEAAFDVQLARTLDLSTRRALRQMRLTQKSLRAVDWRAANARGQEALTQAIGRLAAMLALEGLIVPSVGVRGGRNLVAFPRLLTPGSHIRARGLETLRGLVSH